MDKFFYYVRIYEVQNLTIASIIGRVEFLYCNLTFLEILKNPYEVALQCLSLCQPTLLYLKWKMLHFVKHTFIHICKIAGDFISYKCTGIFYHQNITMKEQ